MSDSGCSDLAPIAGVRSSSRGWWCLRGGKDTEADGSTGDWLGRDGAIGGTAEGYAAVSGYELLLLVLPLRERCGLPSYGDDSRPPRGWIGGNVTGGYAGRRSWTFDRGALLSLDGWLFWA